VLVQDGAAPGTCLDVGGLSFTGSSAACAARCASLGGSLAVLSNAADWAAATAVLSAAPISWPAPWYTPIAWTGITTPQSALDSSYWVSGQPDNGQGSVAFIVEPGSRNPNSLAPRGYGLWDESPGGSYDYSYPALCRFGA
jgi:hypothetical protein